MGFVLPEAGFKQLLETLSKDYMLFGPKRFKGEHEFSDLDSIRYGEFTDLEDLELVEKSQFSFKDILIPISETLFYFTEDRVLEANIPYERDVLVFLRSCDVHAVKSLDAIYLKNGYEDPYYKRLREKIKFVLIGCEKAFENCFCVDMGTNQTDNYVFSLDHKDGEFFCDVKDDEFTTVFENFADRQQNVEPQYVRETEKKVKVPQDVDGNYVAMSDMWDEYDARCIACGRCNFSCPTCTCFSMQDIFYRDNPKSGERRRVWASCMVDGFTNVAGGGEYRIKHGQRMRFKVLHKIHDFKLRYRFNMCVGCGRCDDVCPEYISFSTAVTRVAELMENKPKEEVNHDA